MAPIGEMARTGDGHANDQGVAASAGGLLAGVEDTEDPK